MDILNFFLGRVWFSEDRISTLSAVLFAVLGILAAVIGYQAERADAAAEIWTGKATQQTMQIASTLATGRFDANFGWSEAFRMWLDTYLKSILTSDAAVSGAYGAALDDIIAMSPIMKEPYFDPSAGQAPKIELYETNVYLVRLTRLQQDFEFTQVLGDYWGSASGDYWLLLKILSTALVLLGLMISLIEQKLIQYAMWALVCLIGIYCGLQTFLISQRPVPTLNPVAMDKVAEGVGWRHQLEYEKAIAAFDEALALEPDYAEAHVQRGFSLRGSYEQDPSPDKLTQAIADFEAAVAAGRQEIDVIAQLAEFYFIRGQFDDAIRITEPAWEDTGNYTYAWDLGLDYLAQGNIDMARTYYDLGAEAAQSNALSGDIVEQVSLWKALDIASVELDDLLRCATEQFCLEAPSYKMIPDAEAVKTFAPEAAKRIKEMAINLEFGLVAGEKPTGTISPMRFEVPAELIIEDNAFHEGLTEMNASFDYDSLPDDSIVIVKTFVRGVEYIPMRHVATIEKGGKGTYTFSMSPGIETGNYRITVFINGTLVDQPSFTILTKGK